MVFELLLADQPARADAHDPSSKFWNWADAMGVSRRAASRADDRPAPDFSHPAMAVNLDACINCTLCVRACREVQVNDVIGMACRGHGAKVVFDFDDPMGNQHLRRLRRVRAGLPDRRADAGDLLDDAAGASMRRPAGRHALPVSAASAASSPSTSRTTRSSTSTAATARPTTTASASRAASASTTSTIPTA